MAMCCRSTTFTGVLAPGEKAEYGKHGNYIKVELSGIPREFWYCPTIQERFVIDPMQWDNDYYAGVQRIEMLMSAHPEPWFPKWIRQHICRCAT